MGSPAITRVGARTSLQSLTGGRNQDRPSDGIVGATANVQGVSGEPVAPVCIRRQPD